MVTQPSLLLLQKNMVVVEGVARKLYPETNIWEVSKPVLEDWLKNLKGPKKTIDTAINTSCLLYTSPSPRDGLLSRMPSSA